MLETVIPEGAALSRSEAARSLRVGPARLVVALILFLAIDHLLLLHFLGAGAASMAAVSLLAGGVAFAADRMLGSGAAQAIDMRILGAAFAISLVLFALGGEGHLAYANIDWQVREAVLDDLVRFPWPFAYAGAEPMALRAPIGMYLVPALAGKWLGSEAADWALLLQNAAIMALVLTLGALLAERARERLFLLAVFLAFSGMDIVGQLLVAPGVAADPSAHIERWSGLEYSSHLTMAFWVPNHALPGWLAAVLFLLWTRGKLPLAGFLAPLPLLALWSPLALIGTLPLAVYASARSCADWHRLIGAGALAAAATLIATPALLYLASDAGPVGASLHLEYLSPGYFVFQMLEVVPLVAAAWRLREHHAVPGGVILLCGLPLAVIPLIEIGENHDFMMRASIPALAILSVAIGQGLWNSRGLGFASRKWIVAALLLGAATPAAELVRAIIYAPPPSVRCSFFAAWDQSFAAYRKTTYVARRDKMPSLLRPTHVKLVQPLADPCWTGAWQRRRF